MRNKVVLLSKSKQDTSQSPPKSNLPYSLRFQFSNQKNHSKPREDVKLSNTPLLLNKPTNFGYERRWFFPGKKLVALRNSYRTKVNKSLMQSSSVNKKLLQSSSLKQPKAFNSISSVLRANTQRKHSTYESSPHKIDRNNSVSSQDRYQLNSHKDQNKSLDLIQPSGGKVQFARHPKNLSFQDYCEAKKQVKFSALERFKKRNVSFEACKVQSILKEPEKKTQSLQTEEDTKGPVNVLYVDAWTN